MSSKCSIKGRGPYHSIKNVAKITTIEMYTRLEAVEKARFKFWLCPTKLHGLGTPTPPCSSASLCVGPRE